MIRRQPVVGITLAAEGAPLQLVPATRENVVLHAPRLSSAARPATNPLASLVHVSHAESFHATALGAILLIVLRKVGTLRFSRVLTVEGRPSLIIDRIGLLRHSLLLILGYEISCVLDSANALCIGVECDLPARSHEVALALVRYRFVKLTHWIGNGSVTR